jgi:flagellar hook-associated protein 2
MSTFTPLRFTGVSEYSDDFQTILNRAVAIASLPVQAIQNEQALLIAKKQALTSLGAKIDGLASAVKNVGMVASSKALNALSSNANRVSVTNNGATASAVYTITDITSVARAASETTASGFATADADQVDADGTLELVIGSTTHTITLGAGENNLNGLRDAINALGAGVSASVLNTGSGGTPYYLSLNANAPGATTLQLRATAGDGGANILTSANQGANAVFKLNGLDVVKSDNVVTDVIPGVSFTIVSTTTAGESVTLTLNSDRGALATALSGLASAYNSLRSEALQHVGEHPGVLAGDFIVRLALEKMRELTTYQGTGAIQSLAELGVTLDSEGKMSFEPVTLYTLSSAGFDASFVFLGSAASGLGALHAGFSSISDPVAGLIRTQQSQYDAADERLQKQVAELGARIEYMQLNLMRQLQNADTVLARLESQQTILDASIQSLNLVLYGRKDK